MFVKLFKNNYKIIIIIILSILLITSKNIENFSTTEALDAVKTTEKKVNDMATIVAADYIDLKSGIRLSKNWKEGATATTSEISNDIKAKNGLMLVGNKSSGIRKVGVWDHLEVHGTQNVTNNFSANKVESRGDVKGKRICIGGTCLTETDLKKMKSSSRIGGYGVGADFNIMLEEGGAQLNKDPYKDWYKKLDEFYIYPGWKLETYHDANFKAKGQKFENKTDKVMKCNVVDNKVMSLSMTWIGY